MTKLSKGCSFNPETPKVTPRSLKCDWCSMVFKNRCAKHRHSSKCELKPSRWVIENSLFRLGGNGNLKTLIDDMANDLSEAQKRLYNLER